MMIFPSHCIRLQGWDSPHRWTEAESGVARFVVDGYVCGRVREFLSGDIKARSGDRAVNTHRLFLGLMLQRLILGTRRSRGR